MNIKKIFFTALLSVFLLACSGKGSEFVGSWENTSTSPTKLGPSQLDIERDGDGFRMTDDGGKNFLPLALQEDGTLKMSVPGGAGLVLMYSEKEDTITVPMFGQFKRK